MWYRHGIRQRLTCWFDGPAYVTQCPIKAGQSFTHKFTLLNQRGTLFWHAHVSWLRATVHGPLIIYPKQGANYPFQIPFQEHVIVLGISKLYCRSFVLSCLYVAMLVYTYSCVYYDRGVLASGHPRLGKACEGLGGRSTRIRCLHS